MEKGFTLVETLAALILLMLAVLFSARIMSFALNQSRQSGLRFRLLETCDYCKNYLSSRPFAAPELAGGSHRQACLGAVVTWRVEAAAAGLKKVSLRAARGSHALAAVFYKSNVIQEVKHD